MSAQLASAQKPVKDSVIHTPHKRIRPDSTFRPRPSQPDTVVIYTPQKKVDSILMSGPTDQVWRLLGAHHQMATYLVVSRNKPGEVEVHERWDDVVIVCSGHATIKTGDHVKDQKMTGQAPTREWKGGVIADVEQKHLSPGDFLIIPAMVAHQFIPDKNETFTYWTIKIRNQQVRYSSPKPRTNPGQKGHPQKN